STEHESKQRRDDQRDPECRIEPQGAANSEPPGVLPIDRGDDHVTADHKEQVYAEISPSSDFRDRLVLDAVDLAIVYPVVQVMERHHGERREQAVVIHDLDAPAGE